MTPREPHKNPIHLTDGNAKGVFDYFFRDAQQPSGGNVFARALDDLASALDESKLHTTSWQSGMARAGRFIAQDVAASVPAMTETEQSPTVPFNRQDVLRYFVNIRSGGLDLESVYAAQTGFEQHGTEPCRLRIGWGGTSIQRPDTVKLSPLFADLIDLERRLALPGAPYQLAFACLHNRFSEDFDSFEENRSTMVQLFRWLVVHDFLPKVCDIEILEQVKLAGAPLYRHFLDRVRTGRQVKDGILPIPLELLAILPLAGSAEANLRLGQRLGLASLQSVVAALADLGVAVPTLTERELGESPGGAVLRASGLVDQVPLWYALQCEAAVSGRERRYGPIGSLLLCETLLGVSLYDCGVVEMPNDPPHLPIDDPIRTFKQILHMAGFQS